jgi:retron-type reverse transcriptase
MRDGTYKTSPYDVFTLVTDHGKRREIYRLPIRDRIAQHAIMIYLEPIFRKAFIYDTYSSIKERGIHLGLKRLKQALQDKEGTKYCLKLDIHKFYPSVDQELMIKTLERKFKDKKLMRLLSEIVRSTDRGLPIGNYTSQYFANFFMTKFDH